MVKRKSKTYKILDEGSTHYINPKSKRSIWAYKGEYSANFSLINLFNKPSGAPILGYKDYYQNFAIKSGNNLVVKSLYATSSGKAKTISTTIKDFFADDASDDNHLKYQTYSYSYNYYTEQNKIEERNIYKTTPEGEDGLFKVMVQDTSDDDYILGTQGKDVINLSAGGWDTIFDTKNDDTYNATSEAVAYIYDLAGNEHYNASGSEWMYVYDYKGKDTYTVKDNISYLMAQDFAGSDRYSFGDDTTACVDFYIQEYKGNDIYTVKNNENKDYDQYAATMQQKYISDYKGKDKYYLTSASARIFDYDGKDYWEIKNQTKNDTLILVDKIGKDKYVISDCSELTYDNFHIEEHTGNDTHIWTSVGYSNDENNYALAEMNGNDKYILTDLSNTNIYDRKGKDKYTIELGNNTNITDMAGNDTYSIKNSPAVQIYDNAGNDKYNVTDSYTVIYDNKGNDKYTFNEIKEFGSIDDSSGKDTLTIKNLNKNDIVFMTNFSTYDNYHDSDCSLIIYDKVNKAYLYIFDFYKDENGDGVYEGYGAGRIETIKAGKANLKSYIPSISKLNSLRESVGAWLKSNSNHYLDVSQVASFGTEQEKNALIAIFEGKT